MVRVGGLQYFSKATPPHRPPSHRPETDTDSEQALITAQVLLGGADAAASSAIISSLLAKKRRM